VDEVDGGAGNAGGVRPEAYQPPRQEEHLGAVCSYRQLLLRLLAARIRPSPKPYVLY
jgi:hypothetical protein